MVCVCVCLCLVVFACSLWLLLVFVGFGLLNACVACSGYCFGVNSVAVCCSFYFEL